MVALASIPRQLPAVEMQNAAQGQLRDALLAKLSALDPKTLDQLHKCFYEAAQKGSGANALPATFAAFACKTPAEALLANLSAMARSYHVPKEYDQSPVRTEASRTDSETQSKTPKPQGAARFYGAQSKGPGLFSNPVAEKAAAALRQQQAQTLNFVNNQLGGAFASGNMTEFLGPNATFEDALAAMLFLIADKDQRDLMEELRNYERGDQGLKGLMGSGARGVASAVGGAAGGILGGWWNGGIGAAAGAAVGSDIGEKIANNYTGQYGNSSKAAQFERIKMKVNEMTQLIQMLSNVLHAFDSANRNTISNMRG